MILRKIVSPLIPDNRLKNIHSIPDATKHAFKLLFTNLHYLFFKSIKPVIIKSPFSQEPSSSEGPHPRDDPDEHPDFQRGVCRSLIRQQHHQQVRRGPVSGGWHPPVRVADGDWKHHASDYC